jgi:uncharacterized protein
MFKSVCRTSGLPLLLIAFLILLVAMPALAPPEALAQQAGASGVDPAPSASSGNKRLQLAAGKIKKKRAAPSAAVAVSEQDRLAAEANTNTVAVVSGTPASAYFRTGGDLALVLDQDDKLRVLNIQGRGAIQNGYDVLLLRGVDLGFVTFDTLEVLKADKRLRGVERQLAYIARLFNNEVQVLAKTDITDVTQLAGKKVSFDIVGSGTNYSGKQIFERLGIEVEAVNIDQQAALPLLQNGEISAIVSVAAKPVSFLAGIKPDAGLHLVAIPYIEALGGNYSPTTITAQDYPSLVPAEGNVGTVGVGTILAVYNWQKGSDRYNRIARFVDAFFSNFDKFQKGGRHPKWKEVNLAANVPGWIRFQAAQEWLDRNEQLRASSAALERVTVQPALRDGMRCDAQVCR